MTIFFKSVSFGNNSRVLGQLIIKVANALDNGSFDLTISCPNIDHKCYLLHPGGFLEWINNGGFLVGSFEGDSPGRFNNNKT